MTANRTRRYARDIRNANKQRKNRKKTTRGVPKILTRVVDRDGRPTSNPDPVRITGLSPVYGEQPHRPQIRRFRPFTPSNFSSSKNLRVIPGDLLFFFSNPSFSIVPLPISAPALSQLHSLKPYRQLPLSSRDTVIIRSGLPPFPRPRSVIPMPSDFGGTIAANVRVVVPPFLVRTLRRQSYRISLSVVLFRLIRQGLPNG